MRSILRFSLFIMTLAFVFSVFLVNETKAQAQNEILNRMNDHYKALQSLEADVKMEKRDANLPEVDVRIGTVKYLPKSCKYCKGKMYVRIDWTNPVEQMAVIGDEYLLYRPRLEQVIKGKTSSAKNNAKIGSALGFLSMSKAELKANYEIKVLGKETVSGGTETFHLELTPKNAASYKVVHLWVDGNGMPIMAKVVEKNNDSTTILLSNLKKNVVIKADSFKIQYPPNIKPIQG